MDFCIELTSTPEKLYVGYVENVTNTPQIRQAVLDKSLDCVVIKGSLVPSPLLVGVAANKAALANSRNTMRTRSIHTEVLYNLSSSTNISQSLNNFGASEADSSLVVCSFNKDLSQAREKISGDWRPLETLADNLDIKLLKKLHKLKDCELDENLLNSLISRVAAKDSL